jgi:serine/threonine protein kinase
MLFTHDVNGFSSWSEVFHKPKAWQALIKAIYKRSDLSCPSVTPLTPGTNAVFRVGQTVVKIFAPLEADLTDASDYAAELEAHREAEGLGLPVPRILTYGVYEDRYPFEYLIMNYIPALDLGDALPKLPPAKQDHAMKQVQDIMNVLHKGARRYPDMDRILDRAIHNPRWSIYTPDVYREAQERLMLHFGNHSYDRDPIIRVHGDMTGENLILDNEGRVYLIDFADSCAAPSQYEHAPIIFALLGLKVDLVKRFFAYDSSEEFVREVFPYILLHDYGAHCLRDICQHLLKCKTDEIQSLGYLEQVLVNHLK